MHCCLLLASHTGSRLTIYTNKPLKVEVLKDTREFCALEEEWEELLQNAPLATPFQSWAWLYSWWEHYGGPYELELVTVRERDGLLVGILPLMLDRRWRFDRLLLLGTGLVGDEEGQFVGQTCRGRGHTPGC